MYYNYNYVCKAVSMFHQKSCLCCRCWESIFRHPLWIFSTYVMCGFQYKIAKQQTKYLHK